MSKFRRKINGKPAVLSVEDYEAISERFNVANVQDDGMRGIHLVIKRSCPLCARFLSGTGSCKGCTFNKFAECLYSYGCTDLIEQLARDADLDLCYDRMEISEKVVKWKHFHDEESRELLSLILEELREFEVV